MFYHGTTDEVSTCDCCGRQGLKVTVAIELEGGDLVHYGVTCAARALKVDAATVRAGAAAADRARAQAAREAEDAARRAQAARWEAHLAGLLGAAAPRDYAGRLNVFQAVHALGGMAAARSTFAG
jgi:hypothetical protein